MLFINTRPPDRAQALTQRLEQADYHVIELPVLALKAKPRDAVLDALFAQLKQVQVIVVVSPTAVHVGMQYLSENQIELQSLQHIQWIAVGQSTADMLRQYGIESIVPEVETSEGMLNLTIFEQIQGIERIAFWRGEGGRQFMMQQCQQRGIQLFNFVLYERYCPSDSIDQIPQLIKTLQHFTLPYFVCISSEASWKNWLQLFSNHPNVIQSCHYVALGERLTALLNSDQKSLNLKFNVSCFHQLKPDVVLQKLEQLKREV